MPSHLKPPVGDQDHIQGTDDAVIELVEYGDYECPHCGAAYPVIKKIEKKFGTQIRFIFRNFPLTESHEHAMAAAIASEAAALQHKFWEMHDIIFENQRSLSEAGLLKLAGSIGLDVEPFKKDITKENLQEKVESDFESGIRSGVNATPTFFINGEKYNDGWESDRMLKFIRANGIGTVDH